MISSAELIAFCAVAGVVIVTPGVDMALVMKNVLARGRTAGFYTIVGVCSGMVVYGVCSALGLSAILSRSTTAFTVVKLAGAAYLIYLGVQAIRASFQQKSDKAATSARVARPGAGKREWYLQGLLSNLLNPKIAVFFLTFIPQFITPDDPPLVAPLLLTALFLGLGFGWLILYLYAIDRLAGLLRGPRAQRILERITGTALIALGVRLARATR